MVHIFLIMYKDTTTEYITTGGIMKMLKKNLLKQEENNIQKVQENNGIKVKNGKKPIPKNK